MGDSRRRHGVDVHLVEIVTLCAPVPAELTKRTGTTVARVVRGIAAIGARPGLDVPKGHAPRGEVQSGSRISQSLYSKEKRGLFRHRLGRLALAMGEEHIQARSLILLADELVLVCKEATLFFAVIALSGK